MSAYLPIGSIVTLDGEKSGIYMIAGYLPKEEDGNVSDYFGVPYPLGLLRPDVFTCFDRNEITELVYRGYSDGACEKLLDGLNQFEKNLLDAFERRVGS